MKNSKLITKNFKAVIFDLDGLIMDSEPLWTMADIQILSRRGHTLTDEIILKRLGTGMKGTIEIYKQEFKITEETDALIKERLIIFSKLLEEKLIAMDGLYYLLDQLSRLKIKLAIASGGPHKKNINKILQKLKIENYFPVIITGEDVVNHKPHPEAFLLAAEKLKINPSDCLVLEDAPNGITAARRAGMKSYGVNKDKKIQKELKVAGADKVFSSLAKIKL
jgi:mannitol-1-/sugar-/sorbitol-6-/2-deoxyglucose-6-phosphatase